METINPVDKWTNCLYINRNPCYNLADVLKKKDDISPQGEYIVKIGSSKHLPARYHSYKTYTPVEIVMMRYYYLHEYDCYQLDADIKVHLDQYRIHSSGGIEFYNSQILVHLEGYMDSRGIKFTRYGNHIIRQ